jgi:ABC-type proline/glycine betaine transport system permease subunit
VHGRSRCCFQLLSAWPCCLIFLPLVGGIGARTAIAALVLDAMLAILRNTYTAMRKVDPAVFEAATGMAMTSSRGSAWWTCPWPCR